jgi:DNA-binding transcriptional regulator YiaG
MEKLMKKETVHYSACGLDYVYLKDVPIHDTSHGKVMAVDLNVIERDIAGEIVRQGVPIRGAEVQFLRKSLGLSMEKFGRLLTLSAPAILKWERARTKRLGPINEVAVRALMAEQLDIEMKGRFTVLKGNSETPIRLLLKVA